MTLLAELQRKLGRPLVLDGGLSNQLEAQGCSFHSNLWTGHVLIHQQDHIVNAHAAYLDAGADIITTATYQTSMTGLTDAGYGPSAQKIIQSGAALARKAISQSQSTDRLVAGSVGPFGAYLADGSEYHGDYDVSNTMLREFHKATLDVITDSEIDLIACETIPSYDEAAVLSQLLTVYHLPVWVSFSCADGATLRDGTPVEQCAQLFKDHPTVFAVGINCTNPEHVTELIPRLVFASEKQIVVYPNAGSVYDANRKSWGQEASFNMQSAVAEWIVKGAYIIGGCCQVGPDTIQQIATLVSQQK